jgi:hypothetical protein
MNLFRNISGFIFISFILTSTAYSSLQLKGYIEIPEKEAGPIEFTVRHLGKTGHNDKDGFFTIPISDITLYKKPSFIICKKEFGLVEGRNTVHTLALNSDKPYRYFEESDDNILVEKKLPNGIIPANCVMLLINPKLVASVKSWDIELNPNIIKLPKVTLRSDVKKEELQKASDKSLLYTLDLNRFHELIQNTTKDASIKNKGRTEISLVQ